MEGRNTAVEKAMQNIVTFCVLLLVTVAIC